MAKNRSVQVFQQADGRWAVWATCAHRADGIATTQEAAIKIGRLSAITRDIALVVRRADWSLQLIGSFEDFESERRWIERYGNDPFPPKSKK